VGRWLLERGLKRGGGKEGKKPFGKQVLQPTPDLQKLLYGYGSGPGIVYASGAEKGAKAGGRLTNWRVGIS